MKTRLWLLLTLLALMAGCGPGYYERGPGYRPGVPAWQPYQYSESWYDYDLKIWREESGR
jgi:hypothetical protein